MTSSAIAIVDGAISILRGYAVFSLVIAIIFVIFWVQNVDPSAKGGGLGFRILIVPGVAVFWPLFAYRILRKSPHPIEKTAHRTYVNSVESHP
ncbi:MAG: hypothetical protein AAF268_05300 [Cyanobacteria bacterium P01_A01_bin.3]